MQFEYPFHGEENPCLGNIKSQIKLTHSYKEQVIFCHPSCNIWKQLSLVVKNKAILKVFA